MNKQGFAWRGVHHLALITNDMESTVRFWHGVVGAPLIATIGNDDFRHYFFDVGGGAAVAFFEYKQPVAAITKPAGVFHPDAGNFDHLSLNVADQESLEALRDRLETWGCEVTTQVDHGLMASIYFTDPNGIALEASCWQFDPSSVIDRSRFGDPNPVPAVEETLVGSLTLAPATRLIQSAPD